MSLVSDIAPVALLEEVLRYSFKVTSQDTDDRGALSLCRIMNEVTAINDKAIIRSFGSLDYDAVSVSSYYLDVLGAAFLDEEVRFESQLFLSVEDRAELLVFVEKGSGEDRIVIAEGSFAFRHTR